MTPSLWQCLTALLEKFFPKSNLNVPSTTQGHHLSSYHCHLGAEVDPRLTASCLQRVVESHERQTKAQTWYFLKTFSQKHNALEMPICFLKTRYFLLRNGTPDNAYVSSVSPRSCPASCPKRQNILLCYQLRALSLTDTLEENSVYKIPPSSSPPMKCFFQKSSW